MIYYFSGTGNSKWVAEELARLTFDTAVDICTLEKDGIFSLFVDQAAPIGLVFPIYAWAIPKPMKRFIKTIKLQGSYHFAVCTCGDEAGYALNQLHRFFPLKSAYSISMPNNYVVGFDVDAPTIEAEKLANAKKKIQRIAEVIKLKQSVYDIKPGKLAFIKTYLIAPLFNCFALSTKAFYATDSCDGCGLCVKKCPLNTIQLQDNKPVWHKECYQCQSCINRCPKAAIQYGKSTISRGRYYFGHK